MKRIIALLVGENQSISTVVLMIIPALSFSMFILMSFSISFATIITACLGLDIFAGLLSNLQPKTHQAWRSQPNISRIIFVVVHLTVYPSLVILCQVSIPLMGMMLVMLLAKTTAFSIGSFPSKQI